MRLITLSVLAFSAMVATADAQQSMPKCWSLELADEQTLMALLETANANPKYPAAGGVVIALRTATLLNKLAAAHPCPMPAPPPPSPPAPKQD